MTRLKSFLLFLVIGCTTEKPASTDSAATGIEPLDTSRSTTRVSASTDPSTWKVSVRGIGPITAGMTLAEANAAVGNRLDIPPTMEECTFIRFKRGSENLMFMVERGTISRVDVIRDSPITTEAGAKIGDTEAQIKSLYPAVETQPHKYTDGHYLVVTPSATSDQAYRLVFETDGQKVLRYRSGRMPAVEYVEGCS